MTLRLEDCCLVLPVREAPADDPAPAFEEPEMAPPLQEIVHRPASNRRITTIDAATGMTGEEIGTACDRLRALDGVLDLSTATRRGKKNRPMESFRLLVRPDALAAVQAACLTETSTIGLRWHEESRLCLIRELDQRDGIRRKRVRRPGGVTTFKAESDDLTGASLAERRRLARQCEED